jgi:hypothetical protein
MFVGHWSHCPGRMSDSQPKPDIATTGPFSRRFAERPSPLKVVKPRKRSRSVSPRKKAKVEVPGPEASNAVLKQEKPDADEKEAASGDEKPINNGDISADTVSLPGDAQASEKAAEIKEETTVTPLDNLPGDGVEA